MASPDNLEIALEIPSIWKKATIKTTASMMRPAGFAVSGTLVRGVYTYEENGRIVIEQSSPAGQAEAEATIRRFLEANPNAEVLFT